MRTSPAAVLLVVGLIAYSANAWDTIDRTGYWPLSSACPAPSAF